MDPITVDEQGEPLDTPPLRVPAAPVLVSWTPPGVRAALLEHDSGQFGRSAALAEQLLRDADCQAAVTQRILGVLGLPFELEPADDSAAAIAFCDRVRSVWPRILPVAAVAELLRWYLLLGFAHAQVVFRDTGAGMLPTVEPWHPAFTGYMPGSDCWYALGQGPGPYRSEIRPDNGWITLSPHSPRRGYIMGAVRSTAEWFLRAAYTSRDAARWSETKGQGIWKAKIPAAQIIGPEGTTETPYHRFVASLRTMGTNPVIPLAQGATPQESYDVDLLESKSDVGWKGFEFILAAAARRFRLVILGQDMTSVSGPDGGSYAQSKVGNDVRGDLKAFDAHALSECVGVLLRMFAAYETGNPDLAPRACWDADEDENVEQIAAAWKSAADAVATARTAGVAVDAEQAMREVGMPVLDGAAPQSPPMKASRLVRLGRSPRRSLLAPMLAGQTYLDDVVDASAKHARAAFGPIVAPVVEIIQASRSYDDLRMRLATAFPGMDVERLRRLLQGATMLAVGAGAWSVEQERVP